MPLTVAEVRNGRPDSKAYKLADEKGLHLFVTPKGGSPGGRNIATAAKRRC